MLTLDEKKDVIETNLGWRGLTPHNR